MSNAEAIIAKLNDLNAAIQKAQAEVNQGIVVKLSYLDAEVSQVCEQVLQLPPAEAKKTQPIMAEMISNLDTLALTLQNFQDEMKEKLD